MKKFSVIMPTYNQAGYIRNSIRSLFAQTYDQWELIIVNDGCTDNTEELINDYLVDERVRYIKNETNLGLGTSINRAMEFAKYDYIAYLPSDDYYYNNHLQVLYKMYEQYQNAVLLFTTAHSEVKDSLLYSRNTSIGGLQNPVGLQLVQVSHKRTSDRWTEREEWISEDLYKTFWYKLIDKGLFLSINMVTCHFSKHPQQRHRLMSEAYGGHLNKYRLYYKVQTPLRAWVSERKFVDEVNLYKKFRKPFKPNDDGLKILLVGELSYNQERIYALEEAGHTLYGLWTQQPMYSFSNVGHLPFGHIKDLDYTNWEEEIKRIKPNIIYGLLNTSAVPIAHEVLRKFPDIPFVWHFKEGPFLCLEYGLWNQLIELYTKADGKIFINNEVQKWYEQYIPTTERSLILDGDLPKRDYFTEEFSSKLSDVDGEPHTVIAGRMVGLGIEDIMTLARTNVHIHLYNESYDNAWKNLIKTAQHVAPKYFHVHKHCDPNNWTKEFSQYDAGWLHCITSTNRGRYDSIGWNDLNMPARIGTMMAAGIPCIQKDNSGNILAMQSCIQNIDCGIFFKNFDDLGKKLNNRNQIKNLQENVMKHRMSFSFDEHVPDLIHFFKEVIKNKK